VYNRIIGMEGILVNVIIWYELAATPHKARGASWFFSWISNH